MVAPRVATPTVEASTTPTRCPEDHWGRAGPPRNDDPLDVDGGVDDAEDPIRPIRQSVRGLASRTVGVLRVLGDLDRPPGQGCHAGRPAAVRGQSLVECDIPCAETRSLSPAQFWFRSGSFFRSGGSKCRIRRIWAGLSGP